MSKVEVVVIGMDVEQHSTAIRSAVSISIEGFILVGECVAQAQKELGGDDFAVLFDKSNENYVGLGVRQGYRFLSIFKGQKKLLKFKGDLPSDVTQLDQVSGMSEKDIKAGIKAEVIGADMNRGDITKWLNAQNGDQDNNPPPSSMMKEPVIAGAAITEAVIIEDEAPESEKQELDTTLYDALRIVLEDTEEKDKLRTVKGLMKKWGISLTDLT